MRIKQQYDGVLEQSSTGTLKLKCQSYFRIRKWKDLNMVGKMW